MAFVDDAAAALAAAYAEHGIPALWTPAAGGEPSSCLVVLAEPDTIVGFGKSRAALASHRIEVRAVEVAAPAKGDLVTLNPGAPARAAAYRITGKPTRDDYGLEFACEASPA